MPAASSWAELADSLHRPLVVFDSGIGGLSVLSRILPLWPQGDILYLADNAFYPYGEKSEEQILHRCQTLTHTLAPLDPVAFVCACNTISTLALPLLRQLLSCPVVGTVPAIKPAALISRRRHIALIATPATCARPYIDTLHREHAADCRLLRLPSSTLVHLAEDLLRGLPLDEAALAHELRPLILHPDPPDVAVLGCTHFPFLGPAITRLLPDLRLLDAAEPVARQLCRVASPVRDPQLRESRRLFVFSAHCPRAKLLQASLADDWQLPAPILLPLEHP